MNDEAFVGRSHELEKLARLAEMAAGGRGGVVLVPGEAGLGKTRFVEVALGDWRRRGFETYTSAASEMEQWRRFGVIVDALRLRGADDPGRARIREVIEANVGTQPEGGPRDPEALASQVAEQVVGYLEERSATARGPQPLRRRSGAGPLPPRSGKRRPGRRR